MVQRPIWVECETLFLLAPLILPDRDLCGVNAFKLPIEAPVSPVILFSQSGKPFTDPLPLPFELSDPDVDQ